MIKRSGTRSRRILSSAAILRRQSSKKKSLIRKYREGPITSTLLKSGDYLKLRLFRASDLRRDHKLILADMSQAKKNWFMRFLDRARDVLYDPNCEKMIAFRARLEYNLNMRKVEEYYEL